METKTRIGVICDLHLNGNTKSPQYAFLKYAVERMKNDSVNTVICVGDVTAHGEIAGFEIYRALMEQFDHYEVSGNSDVRDRETAEEILKLFQKRHMEINGRKILGIHTPYGYISEEDKALLRSVKQGDIIYLHHDLASLQEESAQYLTTLSEQIPITIVHGHLHKWCDYKINDSRVVGVKCLDPDKCIGSFPCITYVDLKNDDIVITEQSIELPVETMLSVSQFFGLSCVDNRTDVSYALANGIKNIELRCIDDWTPDWELLPLIQKWREHTNGYLSVHMPDIRIKDETIIGIEQWNKALEYALAVKADGLTMHTPRVKRTDIPVGSDNWNAILNLYTTTIEKVNPNVRVGIENLHVNKGENVDEHRGFGYTPEEVMLWISSIETKLGVKNRVGHVLDVGHARNNGALAEIYPISRWYEIMGNRTVAYHIHQVVPETDSYRNHCAIENWFGPMINYTSFFYSWQAGLLNPVPVFLEVKGHTNYEKSICAFRKILGEREVL